MKQRYTQQELEEAVNFYKFKYGNKIAWDTIFNNVKYFVQNREAILADYMQCLSWYGFLYYLAWIESTIGLYRYTKIGTFHRIFVMFGRALLEEREVITVTKQGVLPLTWISEDNAFFKTGDGKKGDIDLEDPYHVTYDVKNDQIDFSASHTADFLIKYRSYDGYIEVHKQPETPKEQSFVRFLNNGEPAKTLKELADALNLDPLLFNKHSSENEIRQYLGLDPLEETDDDDTKKN